MALADLEFDYINPYDSSSQINKVILSEALVYVTFVYSIPLLQCEAVSFIFFPDLLVIAMKILSCIRNDAAFS
ncbi:hypothetical protein NC652_026021 [Populus alba x Populus x berolinensis]|nr:hypothetical protein NC652_026021 [Populus alba x Populus x berolinensis]